jgi:hypothetical protein
MDTLETAPTSEPVAPPETPDPAESSIAAHAAQFGPESVRQTPEVEQPETPAAQRARDTQTGQFAKEPKHRAKSQQAAAGDAPRIAELTKKWREAERRAEEAERRATARIPETDRREAPRPDVIRDVPKPPPTAQTAAFSDAEPTFDQFANEADPYAAYLRALGRYDRKKEAWDASEQQRQTQAETAQRERETSQRTMVETYATKTGEFRKTHPDFDKVIEACPVNGMTPVLEQALLRSDNGPDLVYYLAQHPDLYDEMLLLTDGKPVEEYYVALAQRRLVQRAQAAPTGSAAASRTFTQAARPPNPVRTGPLKAGDEPPGDGASIAEHAKFYGPKAR